MMPSNHLIRMGASFKLELGMGYLEVIFSENP